MNDITPLLILFALTNRSGFNTMKGAFDAADSFNAKIGNLTSIMSMLPKISGIMNQQGSFEYIDTLKDIISRM